MEAWMHYDRMLPDVFQQMGAYPYPFGSDSLGWLYEVSDEHLRRRPYPRLRDQAISVDQVFAEFKGEYLALWRVAELQGMTPYLDEEISKAAHALRLHPGCGVHLASNAVTPRVGGHDRVGRPIPRGPAPETAAPTCR